MRGQFKVNAISEIATKSGSYGYTFIQGYQKNKNALFTNATVVTCWIKKKLDLPFMSEVTADIDIRSSVGKDGKASEYLNLFGVIVDGEYISAIVDPSEVADDKEADKQEKPF